MTPPYTGERASHADACWNQADEGQGKLIDRICAKLSLQKDDLAAVKEGKDGAGLLYEFEGGRWALDDGSSSRLICQTHLTNCGYL